MGEGGQKNLKMVLIFFQKRGFKGGDQCCQGGGPKNGAPPLNKSPRTPLSVGKVHIFILYYSYLLNPLKSEMDLFTLSHVHQPICWVSSEMEKWFRIFRDHFASFSNFVRSRKFSQKFSAFSRNFRIFSWSVSFAGNPNLKS